MTTIEQKKKIKQIKEHLEQNGQTITWLASKIGYGRQALYAIFNQRTGYVLTEKCYLLIKNELKLK
jgi:DNA transposition AAA+ family ATPase